MKITMKEIAKLANVSQSTVSRVINGNKGVNEEAAQRVLEVIEKVGFIPNKAAQTLKRSKSHIIGVLLTETYNPYFVELIDKLESESRKRGYNILLHVSNRNPIVEWESVQNFIARQVDGMIIIPSGEYNIERISKLPIPSIVMTQNWKPIDSIGLDHILAGKMVAEKFVLSGHKTFGFVGTAPDEKFLGFSSGLQENGVEFADKNYIVLQETSTNNFLIRRDIDAYLEQAGGTVDFTCCFAANDIMALEFMRAIEDRGMKVPEDISIIGFDDTYLAKIMGISSVHQPIEEMVNTTLELLLDRVENEVTSEPVQIKLNPTLVERSSSNLKK
ncbi:LacI family DNA-binding transcriptional regulator [Neobacillus niacini]|uniref:LacI family DNA-binding transcriptional regulator n=1 Tax=Neobacillus niacini TaxID=86668 RepID=UPI0021CB8F23|nr:LacI family DNA-binding transcriptional regulator [Neobacillus niacini]MCM3763844.1 LacI family transcriptional regulator [Neobacillus niacini]